MHHIVSMEILCHELVNVNILFLDTNLLESKNIVNLKK